VKSAEQFLGDLDALGPANAVSAIEARDREVRAAALEEAAEIVRADRGEIECVTDLLDLAAADAIPDAAVVTPMTIDDYPAHRVRPVPSRAELIELMYATWFANWAILDRRSKSDQSDGMARVLDALIKAGVVK